MDETAALFKQRPETKHTRVMDIILARTFLTVADTGSFIEAARSMNVTQSTVSARIKGLEDSLGRPLFDRSNNGATLTSAGNQFQKHALAMVRLWQRAQLEVGLSAQHRDHLAVGAGPSLWDGFLIKWVSWLRGNIPDIAVSASAASAADLTQRLVDGTLDLAVMYRPSQPPGLTIEHLFDEEFVQVSSQPAGGKRGPADYVFVDWGPDFQLDHAAAHPDLVQTGLNLDIGTTALDFLMSTAATGYFPLRLVKGHVARGRLRLNKRARKFVYPVSMVYPEARDEDAYEPILEGLRKSSAGFR
jgi:LysR family transcriptional regulator, flagellar master operon regulator